MTVRLGLERLLSEEIGLVRNRRVGLVCNPTSVDRSLAHAADILAARRDLELVALFGPEHGVRGEAQDMVAVDGGRDHRTGLPVHSLYGEDPASIEPAPAMLVGLDVLVFDVQDVGSRYYTYAWTLCLAMRAAARLGVEVVVCDRPNPLGGALVEGGTVRPGFESFVGLHPVANRHGLTVGELATLVNERHRLGCRLHVVRMEGWRREMSWAECGLPWVLPSPNMPTPDTALVYPGLCLLEGTEASEGRGTTRPFEILGAPWVDGHALAAALTREDLPGVAFRPLAFRPTFHKFAGEACGGVQLHVLDTVAFRPYLTGVAVLRTLRALWPNAFGWRTRRYEFVDGRPAIDLLAGSDELRRLIDAGAPLAALRASWQAEEDAFRELRAAYLLYG